MTDMQAQNGTTVPAQGLVDKASAAAAADEALNAITNAAQRAAAEDRGAEAKDWAAAALQFAQTIITLDPSRLTGGDTPQARAAAQPPQPPAATPKRPPTRDANRNGIIGG